MTTGATIGNMMTTLNKNNNKLGEKIMATIYTERLVCPRCECYMYPPRVALSRLDNATSVCPDCGVDEAIEQWVTGTIANYKLGETK
jgi:hypothetical protein